MKLTTATAATLKHLADAGDKVAQALVIGSKDLRLTAGAEAVNVIKVTGQMVDGVGNPVSGVQNVLVNSVPVAGAGTLTDGGFGVVIAGSASKLLWMTTDASGKFQVDVLNAIAELNLLEVTTDNGDVAQLVLTFA